MGWIVLRKTFRIGPFHINVSRRGVGFSVGRKGLRIGRSATGRGYVAASKDGVTVKKSKKL